MSRDVYECQDLKFTAVKRSAVVLLQAGRERSYSQGLDMLDGKDVGAAEGHHWLAIFLENNANPITLYYSPDDLGSQRRDVDYAALL